MEDNTVKNKNIQDENIINIRERYKIISAHLNEKTRRIWCATEAKSLGWGGETIVHKATNIAYTTIKRGLNDLEDQNENKLDVERIRKEGGGRHNLKEKYPNLLKDLESLVEPLTRGDPESGLLWTNKSTEKLSQELNKKGYKISQRSVCDLLSELGYSLQSNKKTKERS